MTDLTFKRALVGTAIALGMLAGQAKAGLVYNFSGTDSNGVGSATMDFSVSSNALTVKVDNTSPTNLVGGTTGGNSPGISGFGFNLDPATLVLQSWSMTAFTNTGTGVTIGSSGTCNGCDWLMGTTLASITVDYLPNNGGVADGMLFNPAALQDSNNTLPGGQNDVFFTTATLTMNFNEVPSLNDENEWSPFVRMQNVGTRGGGSLKLPGTPGDDGGTGQNEVPEPGSLALAGLALLGAYAVRRRRI